MIEIIGVIPVPPATNPTRLPTNAPAAMPYAAPAAIPAAFSFRLSAGRSTVLTVFHSAIAALATVTLRASPRRGYSPFVKAGVGFALLGQAFDAVTSHSSNATCTDCARIILEGRDRLVTWAGTAAAGVAIGGVSGHLLRVEVRDVVLGLPVVTGPAHPLAGRPLPPTSTRAVHRFILAFGLDIVLSERHSRRY